MEVGLNGGVRGMGEQAKMGLLPADMRSHQKCLIQEGHKSRAGFGEALLQHGGSDSSGETPQEAVEF